MLWHFLNILPVLFQREAHDVEDSKKQNLNLFFQIIRDGFTPVQLVVVVRIGGFDVLLSAVENGLGRQQLGKYAADGPNVCKNQINILDTLK